MYFCAFIHDTSVGEKRENERSDQHTEVSEVGQNPRKDGIDDKTERGDERHHSDDRGDVEFLGKEGKNEVDRELGAEVCEHQSAEQSPRDPIGLVKGDEEQGRQAKDRRHCKIRAVAREFGSFVAWGRHKISLS